MSAYKSYPKYKPSGVEWLGDVPEAWEVTKLKFTAAITPSNIDKKSYEDELPISLCNYTDVYYNETITRAIEFMAATATREQIRKFSLRQHDVIITKDSEDPNDIAVPSLVAETMDSVVCGYHLTLLRPLENVDGRFLKRYFDSKTTRCYFATRANGLTRYGLGSYPLSNASIVLPPLAEQLQIAAFLDRECGKLDALQAKQERLIELLKEKRQALISHAVTRGLDAAAKLKPSGIEWLGDVPEHWRVGKCGFYLSILSGFAFPSAGFTQDESQTKLLRGINVGVSRIKWDETVYWQRSENDGLGCYELKAGDLVVGMDRPWISEGVRVAKVSVDDLPCLLLQRVTSLKTSSRLLTEYLFRILSSEMFVAYFTPDTTGVSVPHLSPDQICDFVIPIPPLAEQRAIVAHLDEKCGKIDQLKAKAERGIELLKERRSALISAAVTGKIDVRTSLKQTAPV